MRRWRDGHWEEARDRVADEVPVALTFVPGVDRGTVLARLETAEWSGIFSVQERCNRYDAAGMDLLLEPVVSLAADKLADAQSHHAWRKVGLLVEDNQLSGQIEGAGAPMPLTLRRSSSGTGTRSASPRAGAAT